MEIFLPSYSLLSVHVTRLRSARGVGPFTMSSIPNDITPQYLAESRSYALLAAAIPVSVIAITAVFLRFWARRRVKARIWWDDYTIVLALVQATPSGRTEPRVDLLLDMRPLQQYTHHGRCRTLRFRPSHTLSVPNNRGLILEGENYPWLSRPLGS